MNKNISSAWLLRKRNGWMSSCRHTITRTNGFASGISGVIVLFHRSKKNPSWKPSSYKFDWSLKWCHCRIMGWIWLDYIYIYMYIFRKCRLDDSELVMGMGNEWCLLFFCWARSLGICRIEFHSAWKRSTKEFLAAGNGFLRWVKFFSMPLEVKMGSLSFFFCVRSKRSPWWFHFRRCSGSAILSGPPGEVARQVWLFL